MGKAPITRKHRFTRKEIEGISKYICSQVAKGRSLAKIIEEKKDLLLREGENPDIFPSYSTYLKWLMNYDEVRNHYQQAKLDGADYLADEIIEIADEPVRGMDQVSRNKLRIDTRKWIAAKLKPRTYGERTQVDVTVEERISDEEMDRRLRYLIGKLKKDKVFSSGVKEELSSVIPLDSNNSRRNPSYIRGEEEEESSEPGFLDLPEEDEEGSGGE
jgi:hypothetical protein